MLTKSGVKVLDFGLAKLHEPPAAARVDYATATAPLTDIGAVLGTMPYMAPEQVQGRDVDVRVDQRPLASRIEDPAATSATARQPDLKTRPLTSATTHQPGLKTRHNPRDVGPPPEMWARGLQTPGADERRIDQRSRRNAMMSLMSCWVRRMFESVMGKPAFEVNMNTYCSRTASRSFAELS